MPSSLQVFLYGDQVDLQTLLRSGKLKLHRKNGRLYLLIDDFKELVDRVSELETVLEDLGNRINGALESDE